MKYKTKKSCWRQDIRHCEYAKAALQGILLTSLLSYLFYGTILWTIFISPYLIWFMKSWREQYIKKKKQEFQLQFKEAIQAMSTALRVGYSVENAVREADKELRRMYRSDEKILTEFQYMVHQLDMNITLENILREFAVRVEDREVQTFVTVFAMAKRSGGDMIRIIRSAISQISEKIDVQREIAVMISAKRLEFRVMSAIPVCMILYMKLSFPDFMDVLYGNAAGVLVMTICLLVYIGAYEVGRRMIEIEV